MQVQIKDLKPGDVYHKNGYRMVVLNAGASSTNAREMNTAMINTSGQNKIQNGSIYSPTEYVELEAPSRAQQHADEMLELLLDFQKSGGIGINAGQRVEALLTKIDPPKPITVDEAINVVRRLMGLEPNPPGFAEAFLRRFEASRVPVQPAAPSLPLLESYSKGCIQAKSVKYYKDFIAAGWTDVQLIQEGYMK